MHRDRVTITHAAVIDAMAQRCRRYQSVVVPDAECLSCLCWFTLTGVRSRSRVVYKVISSMIQEDACVGHRARRGLRCINLDKSIVDAIDRLSPMIGTTFASNRRVSLRSVLNILNLRLDLCRSSIDVLSHVLDIILELAARILDLESPNALSEDLVHSERYRVSVKWYRCMCSGTYSSRVFCFDSGKKRKTWKKLVTLKTPKMMNV